jgi:hypothetical protein
LAQTLQKRALAAGVVQPVLIQVNLDDEPQRLAWPRPTPRPWPRPWPAWTTWPLRASWFCPGPWTTPRPPGPRSPACAPCATVSRSALDGPAGLVHGHERGPGSGR